MKTTILVFLFFLTTNLLATTKTICGDEDNRIFSYDQKVGKLLKDIQKKQGCTATMISKSCAISAGHCYNYFKFMEFNVPHLDSNGDFPEKDEENIYQVNQDSIVYKNEKNEDWGVFSLLPNSKTKLYPGTVQGKYDISLYNRPVISEQVRITGYGVVQGNRERSRFQQMHSGELTKIIQTWDQRRLQYRVDTTGGNSGSAIFSISQNAIIGIHTNAGCNYRDESSNFGTMIYDNRKLATAIRNCLMAEKKL